MLHLNTIIHSLFPLSQGQACVQPGIPQSKRELLSALYPLLAASIPVSTPWHTKGTPLQDHQTTAGQPCQVVLQTCSILEPTAD